MKAPTFQDASERLEGVFNAVAGIASGCDLETARALLDVLELDDVRYGKIIAESLVKLAAVSDGPIKWAHGRGLSTIARTPKMVYPHVWSSAHEAAFRLSRLARELFDSPEALTKRRRKALVMTMDEVADYQERIRRERAKMLVAGSPPGESPVPQDGTKYTKDTLPREYRDGGRRDGDPLTAKYLKEEWQITGSDLSKYGAKGVINHHVLLGKQYVYLLEEVEELREIKTANQARREEDKKPH